MASIEERAAQLRKRLQGDTSDTNSVSSRASQLRERLSQASDEPIRRTYTPASNYVEQSTSSSAVQRSSAYDPSNLLDMTDDELSVREDALQQLVNSNRFRSQELNLGTDAAARQAEENLKALQEARGLKRLGAYSDEELRGMSLADIDETVRQLNEQLKYAKDNQMDAQALEYQSQIDALQGARGQRLQGKAQSYDDFTAEELQERLANLERQQNALYQKSTSTGDGRYYQDATRMGYQKEELQQANYLAKVRETDEDTMQMTLDAIRKQMELADLMQQEGTYRDVNPWFAVSFGTPSEEQGSAYENIKALSAEADAALQAAKAKAHNTGADWTTLEHYAESQINKERADAMTENAKNVVEDADSIVGAMLRHSGSQIFGGLGALDMTAQAIGNTFRGSENYLPIDPNTNYNRYSILADAYQQGGAELVEKYAAADPILSKFLTGKDYITGDQSRAQYLYNVGVSSLDSAVNLGVAMLLSAGISGFFPMDAQTFNTTSARLVNAIMGSSAATSAIRENLKSGDMTDAQAVTLGIMSGVAEAMTESWSIETLLNGDTTAFARLVNRIVKNPVANNLLKGFISEGSEEIASNWLNRLFDYIVRHDKSETMQDYNAYLAQGDSSGEAWRKIFAEWLQEDASAGLAGSLAGLTGGASHYALTGTVDSVDTYVTEREAEKARLQAEQNARQEAPTQQTTAQNAQQEQTTAQTEDAMDRELNGKGRVPYESLSEDALNAWDNHSDVSMDAENRVYKVDPAQHISRRTSENVSDRNMNAFQFDHPELQVYYRQAAQALSADAAMSLDAPVTQKTKRGNAGKQTIREIMATPSLREGMDMGLSRSDIIRAAENLAADHGQENNAAAKRLEIVLDKMLTEGYQTASGETVAPNEAYMKAKKEIPGFTEQVREELPMPDMDGVSNVYSSTNRNRSEAEVDSDILQVARAATVLGESGTKALTDAYDRATAQQISPEEAVTGFTHIYNAALENTDIPNENLPAHMRMAAEYAGQNDARRAKQAKYFGKDAMLVRDEAFKKAHLSSRMAMRLDALAKVLGVRIRFAEEVNNGLSNAAYGDGEIVIALDTQDPLNTVAIHEAIHRLRETNPKLYNELSTFIQANLSTDRYLRSILERMDRYQNSDLGYLTEEMVADAFGRIMKDGKLLDRYVQDNRTGAEKLRDLLLDIVNAVRRALNHQDLKLSREQKAEFQELEKQYSAMAQKLTKALDAAARKTAEQNKNAATTGGEVVLKDGVKYSKKLSFAEQVDAVLHGEFDRYTDVYVMDTPSILQAFGLKEYPMLISQKHLRDINHPKSNKNSHWHGLSESIIQKIPSFIESPAIVMESATKSGDIVVVSSELASDGLPIVISIHPDGSGRYNRAEIASNFVTSVYGKNGFAAYINAAIADNRIRYNNKKRTQSLFANARLQLPGSLLKDGFFNDSISTDQENVNRKFSPKNDGNERTRYSLKEYSEEEKKQHVKDAVSFFGKTYKWAETGYITTDGSRLDFSGKHEGGPGGYRTVDHRDIRDALGDDYGGDDYSGGMVQFMSEGNIRIMPESGGINLSVMPTKAQMETLSGFISSQRGEVILDLDTPDGQTVFSTEYPRGTHANKVLSDIRGYFEDGTKPYVSDLARFRYSLKQFDDGKRFVEVETDQAQFDGLSLQEMNSLATKIIKQKYGNKVVGIDNRTFVNGKSADEYVYYKRGTPKKVIEAKARASTELDNLIDAGTNFRTAEDGADGHVHPDVVDGFSYFDTIFKVGPEYYKGVINIKNIEKGKLFWGVTKTENITQDIGASYGKNPTSTFLRDVSMETVTQEKESVKREKSKEEIPTEELLAELVKRYGAMPTGENPFRDIVLPKKTAKELKLSQTVRTILEAKATPEVMVPSIQELAAEGTYSYQSYSDEAALSDAEAKIRDVGWGKALEDWNKAVRSGEVSKANTAMGWALYDHAANSGDTATALMVLNNMVEHQRSAAQAVQATRILKQMNPETQLYGVQRSVANLQKEINERYGKKGVKLIINEDLAERFMKAETQTERDNVLADIYRDIGRQMPSSFMDKWNAWRYLSMLGNPRTHVRNIVGNAGFVPVVAVKNLTATGIEAAVNFVSRGQLQRTKRLIGFSSNDRAILKAAWNDYAKIEEAAMGGGKYSDYAAANKYVEEGRRIFRLKGLEWLRKTNGKLLDQEDVWFSQPHYTNALAQYCKANHITAEQIAEGGAAIKNARAYAILEAQKATYRDTNAFSQAISDLGRVGFRTETTVNKAIAKITEGILPFRKTPANILVRGIEYSPIGLMWSIKQGLVDVKSGKKTGAQVIDGISAGLTGTGLAALGFYLASQLLVRGGGGDDDKKKNFEDLTGHQTYSLELPDGTSVTLDWLAPECMPFFIGVNLYEMMRDNQGDLTMADMLSAITQVSEPLMELSCLQSLNSVFEAVGSLNNSGVAGLPKALINAATSYFTQGLPTLLGQVERTFEDQRYTTYTEKNAFLTGDMQYAFGKASARIPGVDFQQIPYIDAWGRIEYTGDLPIRALNNFLNPAYTSKISTSDAEKELLRLYEATGDASVLPQRAPKYFTVDSERKDLTAEEYVKYATLKGQKSLELVTNLTKSDAYKKLNDEQKVDAIANAYKLSNQIAKTKISSYKPEAWVQKAIDAEKSTGVKMEAFLIAKAKTADLESIKDKNGDSITNSKGLLIMQQIYSIPGLTDKQRAALFESFGVGKEIRHLNKAAVDEKLQRIEKKNKK